MPSRLEPKLALGAVVLGAALLAAGAALGAERSLVLEVVMNGRATGRVGEFTDRDGVLYAKPSELRELGFVAPQDVAAGGEPIPLSALPNVRAQVNEARQTLVVVASDSALQPTELAGRASAALAPLSRPDYGAVLNYDVVGTLARARVTGGALLDGRGFGPHGLLQSTGFVNFAPGAREKRLVRLETTYTNTQSDKLRRWRVGDVVSGTLPWTRAVRLGGVQVASDFGLRPDLITYLLPQISSTAAVPSTVSVVVNGVRQLSESVQPGPFTVRTLPVVTGAGEVSVAVVDVLGRETLINLPFYASTALLARGLSSYSVEAGAVRQNFGQAGDRYSGWAANGSARYGLTDGLTLEGHGEATAGLALLGGGVTSLIGTLGVVNVAMAGSVGGKPGAMVWSSFQRVSRRASFSVSGGFSTTSYQDIASEKGSPAPKSTLDANLGYRIGALGNIGAAYSRRTSRAAKSGRGQPDESVAADQRVELVTASYSVNVGRASLYATGFKDFRGTRAFGLSLGVSFPLGASSSASVEASREGGRSALSANAAKPAVRAGDYGYRLRASGSADTQLLAEGELLSRWGRVSAGVDHSAGQVAGRAGVSGALVLAGGGLFASDRIFDSFAVVSTGDIAGVPVLYENRLFGTTDARGKLLVPSLLSYQNNRLSLDATRLPADIEVGRTFVLVRPADRSGVMVDFGVRRVAAALLTLHDRTDQPLPLGSVVKVEGAQAEPVGYDGEAYVTGLKPKNRVNVVLQDGTTCSLVFDYAPVKGDIPLIGPLVCQ
ncbi:fimbria/pilus outer membrane usher protein [Caulobacter sp. UNC279MFTsu5.1]|uniref:fimbria/pilus outer membrane usher protein n=1 Tax=Caulobacter sp. UNC279MFTsu5.1 TaxID=1502775 RepID=UPI0008E11D51|nr:fimbria/pilus outer membrane usher protein [Caulobacter sp. UNC279MFTsu5.1]SFK67992.1 outer membrane usher protein [Caulobacter sp. UNC279MFTsu5.1]